MNHLPIEIAETAHLIRRSFDRRALALGATRAQWRVLARLARNGKPMRQGELADALDVEPITMCRMIDRLEDAGLVERRRDEEDRRAWRIHLTAKADPIIAGLEKIAAAFTIELLSGVNPEARAVASETLARIRDNLNADDGEPRRGRQR